MAITLRVNKTWVTPDTIEDLSKWLEKVNDPLVTTSIPAAIGIAAGAAVAAARRPRRGRHTRRVGCCEGVAGHLHGTSMIR